MIYEILLTLGCLLAYRLAYLAYWSMVRPRNFPPGPLGVPFLGSFHYLKNFPEHVLEKMTKKYGDLISIKLGLQNFVCVCGYEAVRDATLNNALCDRRTTYIFKLAKKFDSGILHANYGKACLAYRQLIHDVFTRKLPVKINPEDSVKEEIARVMDVMENYVESNAPIPLRQTVDILPMNILFNFVFGIKITKRSDEENDEVVDVKEGLSRAAQLLLPEDRPFYFPELITGLDKFWLSESAKEFLVISQRMFTKIRSEIESHRATFDQENLRDFVDCYLKKMSIEAETKPSNPIYTEANLVASIYDLIFGSGQNVHKALEYGILYLAGHGSVQKKLFDEILKVLGSKNEVDFTDIQKMPYANAVVHEILRKANPVPVGAPRQAVQDFVFHEYSIPKDTVFVMSTYSCHKDESRWKNAEEFDPENFLTEDGEFQANEAFMVFGGGVRKCPGYNLTKQILFSFLVTMVQKFEVDPETEDTKIVYKPVFELFRGPEPQKVKLSRRK